MSGCGEIVRYLDESEALITDLNAQTIGLVVYQLHLKFKKPLDLDILKRSLELTQRKVPVLNLCIQEKDGKKIFRRRNLVTLDFKVCQDDNLKKVCESLMNTPYDVSEGPLWRSRILLPPTCSEKDDFPFGYYMVFGFHHAITDGTTNCKIIGEFLRILNEHIEGNDVTDDEIGEICDINWLEQSLLNANAKLLANPKLLSDRKERFQFIKERNSIFKIETPPDITNRTLQHMRTLDEESTSKLLKLFKQHNVSFHSGFTACVDLTLLKVFKRHLNTDIYQKLKDITSIHVISTRRYDKQNKDKFGCRIGYINSTLDVNKNSLDYWNRCHLVKEKLEELLADEGCRLDEAAAKILKVNLFDLIGNTITYDYSVSNLGNIDQHFPDQSKHVQCDTVFRMTTADDFGILIAFLVHTFQNKFHVTIVHSVKDLPENIAIGYLEQLMFNLRVIANNGTL